MDDIDFLGFLEKKLDTRIQKQEELNRKAKPVREEPEDDPLYSKPILTKRVAMLLEGPSNKSGHLGESKKEAKDREKMQKQLSFMKTKQAKQPRECKEGKKQKVEEEKDELVVKEKKLVLSKNSVKNNLHLFRGAKVPLQKLVVHKKIDKPKPKPKPEQQIKNFSSVSVKRIENPNKKIKKAKFRDDSDDSAMEVRDMYDIDEENEYAFELGQQEEEEYERLLKLKKQYNKYHR